MNGTTAIRAGETLPKGNWRMLWPWCWVRSAGKPRGSPSTKPVARRRTHRQPGPSPGCRSPRCCGRWRRPAGPGASSGWMGAAGTRRRSIATRSRARGASGSAAREAKDPSRIDDNMHADQKLAQTFSHGCGACPATSPSSIVRRMLLGAVPCAVTGQVCFKLGVDDVPRSGDRRPFAWQVVHSPRAVLDAAVHAFEFVSRFAERPRIRLSPRWRVPRRVVRAECRPVAGCGQDRRRRRTGNRTAVGLSKQPS